MLQYLSVTVQSPNFSNQLILNSFCQFVIFGINSAVLNTKHRGGNSEGCNPHV